MESDGGRGFTLDGVAREGQCGQSTVSVRSRSRGRPVHVRLVDFVKEGTSFKE